MSIQPTIASTVPKHGKNMREISQEKYGELSDMAGVQDMLARNVWERPARCYIRDGTSLIRRKSHREVELMRLVRKMVMEIHKFERQLKQCESPQRRRILENITCKSTSVLDMTRKRWEKTACEIHNMRKIQETYEAVP